MKNKILLVAIFTLSLFVNAQNEMLKNEDIWSSSILRSKSVYGMKSMNDGLNFTTLEYDTINGASVQKALYKTPNKKTIIVSSTIFEKNNFEDLSIQSYAFNATETKILIGTKRENIYRHSSAYNYFIYDVLSKKLIVLTDFSKGKQRLAEFSPTEDKVAFIRENNLFVIDFSKGEEVQVTFDGKENSIINGGTDWVYEEEFGFDKGFEWSPDGKKIGFYKFDESRVSEFQMTMYEGLYPKQEKFKYPKAGEDNALVSIHVYNLLNNKTYDFYTDKETDTYIPRIKWANSKALTIQRLNRLQNKLELWLGDFETSKDIKVIKAEIIYKEKSSTYIDINDNLIFLKNDYSFLWMSEKEGYNHIYRINYKTGSEEKLTTGKWEVTKVYGVDEKNDMLYFQAAKNSPMEREIYKLNLSTKEIVNVSLQEGSNDAVFSNTFDYYILYYSDANTPMKVTLQDNRNEKIKPIVLEDNAKLRENMKKYNLTKQTFFTIKNEEGIPLNAWMIKPPNFDKNKKYPLLMYVYGGPGINTVKNSWGYNNYFWFQSLAQKGYIVISVDARGTGYRGKEFKHSTYLQLGKLEAEDQIAVAKRMGEKPYIDKDRIGIFGWSYGGYLSSLCITKGAGIFKSAIAVAPVTNWRYYDSIYTERFMRTPKENGKNYDDNSPINHVEKLTGNYLLVHGSADDNVHFQNTMEMINALIKENKDFDLMAYPNRNHSIYGGNARLHLYNKMTKFLLEKL